MFFSRGSKTEYGHDVTLEYSENWNDGNLIDNSTKEAFFQSILDYLCLYAHEVNIYDFQLFSLSIAASKDHYEVRANEKDKDNIVMLNIPFPRKDNTLQMNSLLFHGWETRCERFIKHATTLFHGVHVHTNKLLTEFRDNKIIFESHTFKLQPWLDNDPLAQRAFMKATKIDESIRKKIADKTAELNTLKSRLESLSYDFLFNSTKTEYEDIQKDFETTYSNLLHNEDVEICEVMLFCNDELRHLKKLLLQFGNYAGIQKETLFPAPKPLEKKISSPDTVSVSLESLVNASTIPPEQDDYNRSLFDLP